MKCRFYLFKRGNIYYCQLKNEKTGKPLPARSTGTSDRGKAEYIANKWIFEGIPENKSQKKLNTQKIFSVDESLSILKSINNLSADDAKRFLTYFQNQGLISGYTIKGGKDQSLIRFLQDYWNYEKSLYIKEKLSHGHSITKSHCNNMTKSINKYWLPYFEDLSLSALTRKQIKEFSIHLSELKKIDQKGNKLDEHLSAQTINHVLKAGSGPLKWAFDNGYINNNPAANIMKFSGDKKSRGILTDNEVKQLFSSPENWTGNPGNMLANYLSMQTGLRLGEVIALRVNDLESDRLQIRHSFNTVDNLKSTKTGKQRQIPISKDLHNKLLEHAENNPHGLSVDSFIFWNMETAEKPHAGINISRALNTALTKIGIMEHERKSRGLCFHSWRHYYAKKMVDAIDQRTAKLTGHSSPSMLALYSEHADKEDFKKAAEATEEVFGRLLSFDDDKSSVNAV